MTRVTLSEHHQSLNSDSRISYLFIFFFSLNRLSRRSTNITLLIFFFFFVSLLKNILQFFFLFILIFLHHQPTTTSCESILKRGYARNSRESLRKAALLGNVAFPEKRLVFFLFSLVNHARPAQAPDPRCAASSPYYLYYSR